ncbi:MAG: hypothetical protein CVU38_16980 [Chloroflexi bacterium HGW-Chloroflexi-1]|nr:MAG: hypothetical protein CVU38_16980 [Chloroflexi bacterium HGW-Chloroflexi-1]
MGTPPKSTSFTTHPIANARNPAPGNRRAARRTRRRHLGLFWLALLLWAAVLLSVAAAGAGLLTLYRSDFILPGVMAQGLDLGGLTTAGAAELLQGQWRERGIVLDAGAAATWTVSPDALGISLDTDALVRSAHQQGRELAVTSDDPSPLAQARDAAGQLLRLGGRLLGVAPAYLEARRITSPTVAGWLAALSRRLAPPPRVELAPAWRFDRHKATATLRAIAARIDSPPRDADLRIVDGRAEALPSRPGRALDLTAALGQLEAAPWQIAATGRMPLTSVAIPPTIADVSATAAEINRHLVVPLTVRLYDPIVDERLSWPITPDVRAGWLSFSVDASAANGVTWAVAEEKIGAYVTARAETLGAERHLKQAQAVSMIHDAFMSSNSDVPLRVYHFARQHVVQPGETLSSIAFDYGFPYPWIQAANPDLGDLLLAGQAVTIPSPDDQLPLPVVENKRIAISLGEQRMWAYEDGALKWEWVVSTGIPSSPTSPGVFQVQSHEPNAYAASWDLWMPYFMGIYQPAPGQAFMNGFHGFPSRDQRQLLWTSNLGHPVTYGCILLSTENAKTLYEWAEEGVIVAIRP